MLFRRDRPPPAGRGGTTALLGLVLLPLASAAKARVRDRAQAVRYAYQRGLAG